MSSRSFQANSYKYGFNGKEKDDEGMGGGGSTYDYGFRIYNPNLGKFLSVDPIFRDFPWNSPYAFAENDVISSIDLDGLEKYKVGKNDYLYMNNDPNRDPTKAVQYPNGVIKDVLNADEQRAADYLENNERNPDHNPVQIKRTTASDIEEKVVLEDAHKKVDTKAIHKAAAKKMGVPPSVKIIFKSYENKIISLGDAKSQLAKLAKFLKAYPAAKVTLRGNTVAEKGEPTGGGSDALNTKIDKGMDKTNGELMIERAEAVKKILVEDFGIKGSRIKTGTGENGKTKDISIEVK
jgi:RHS repeat-associated protein